MRGGVLAQQLLDALGLLEDLVDLELDRRRHLHAKAPRDCSSFSSFETCARLRMNFSTSSSDDSTNFRSLPTSDSPSTARCQRSFSDTSEIDALNLLRTRSLILRITIRLSLSECASP